MQQVSEHRTGRPTVATPVPFDLPEVAELEPSRAFVLPVMTAFSLMGHGLVLLLVVLLPTPVAPLPLMDEIAITIAEVEEREVVEPPPLVEPEVRPAAQAPRRVVRERPQPAAPLPILTATTESGPAEWAAPPGDPNGVAGGVQGGEGSGAIAAGTAVVGAEPAISRDDLRRMLVGYIRDTLGGFLQGRIQYPMAARRDHQQGVVMLRVRLARDGRILAVRLSHTSGFDMLDRAAIASVQGLGSMPAPPRTIPWDDERELPLPVTYQLEQQ